MANEIEDGWEESDEKLVEETAENVGKGSSGGDNKPEAEPDTESDSESEEGDKSEQKLEEKEEENLLSKLKKADLLKQFPELKNVISEHEEFSKVFPTAEIAQKAAGAYEFMGNLVDSINDGNPELFVTELAKMEEPIYTKFASNFLPTLKKIDGATYQRILDPVIRSVIKFVAAEGKSRNSTDLQYAAGHFAKFLYDDVELKEEKDDPNLEKERQNLDKQKKDFEYSRYQTFRDETYQAAEKKLKTRIADGLDPNKTMSDKMRDAVIKQVFEEVGDAVRADTNHGKLMKQLWIEARANGYTREASDKIINSFVAKFSRLIPSFRQKVRAEFLGTKADVPKEGKTSIPSSGSSGKDGSKRIDIKKIDTTKTSIDDMFDGKITYKT